MDNLKKLRKANELKQSDLASILNISTSSIGLYEQGRREPDYETLKKIADYFGVSTDYLLDRKTNNSTFDDTRQKLTLMLAQRGISVEDLNKLTSDDIAILLSLLEKFIKEKK